MYQRRSQNAEKATHIRWRPLDQAMILFNCAPFQMGTSLKGKNLLPEGANSFLYEQFLIVWKITFITLSDLPCMILFLLRTCVTCVMDATPMCITRFLKIVLKQKEGCTLPNGSSATWPRGYKLFMLNSTEHRIDHAHKC